MTEAETPLGARPHGTSSAKGMVFEIKRFAVHDGPGIRTTVFLKGCPLRCLWCHNPESISPHPQVVFFRSRCIGCSRCVDTCPQGAQMPTDDPLRKIDRSMCDACGACVDECPAAALVMSGRLMEPAEVMGEVVRDKPFYDSSGGGMTLSGGEPAMQPAFVLELLKAARARHIHTALDTSGLVPWPVLESMRGYVDLFLYDLKLIDSNEHEQYTGVANEPILDNLRRLVEAGASVQVRVPIVSSITDTESNLLGVARLVSELGLPAAEPLPFNVLAVSKYTQLGMTFPLEGRGAPSRQRMASIRGLLGRGQEW